MKQGAIGIFDSGIGGLTVAKSIRQLLPKEDLLYFGDTAHLPYGDKSKEAIQRFGLKISDWLLKKGCKAIVIACNTASAHAYRAIRKRLPEHIPVINVIDPMAEVVGNSGLKKVGVIGTKGTIGSRVYVRKIHKQNPDLKVVSKATPLLAQMIEEGYFNNQISRTIIRSYLEGIKNVDGIVLGCTHYPLIKNEIQELTEEEIQIFDSSEVVAEAVKTALDSTGILNSKGGKQSFFLSDFTNSFEKSAAIFFGEGIHLEQEDIWS
jgi:glutamate racemase